MPQSPLTLHLRVVLRSTIDIMRIKMLQYNSVLIRLFVRQGRNPYAGKIGPGGPPRYKRSKE